MNQDEMPISVDVAAPEAMDDAELQAILNGELTDAVSYIDSDISPIRAKGTEYYRGDPFGNEEDGRSQVVAMEVRDTVSAMMPSLMRVFFSSENVVEYVPRGPEDEAGAQQATDYANYVFSADNNGFMKTSQWSQRPHLSLVRYYREEVLPILADNVFIEDTLHGRIQDDITPYDAFNEDGWNKHKLWIYHPEGNIKRSLHLDGRKGTRKFTDDDKVWGYTE